jgi:hypothetical protein
MKPNIRVLVCLTAIVTFFASSCYDRTIRVGGPVATPVPTPPLRVEANIRLEDFRKLCNYLPEEGDQMNESSTDDTNKTVRLTLGNTKRRQNPSAMKAGCAPGATFVFSGPELRLENQ